MATVTAMVTALATSGRSKSNTKLETHNYTHIFYKMSKTRACFVGLGYIGLPTAIIAAKHGVEVTGVDVNPAIVDMTNAGKLHMIEPGLEQMLQQVVADGTLHATTAPSSSDVFLIVVPTPFKGEHEPDLSYVEAATRSVIPFLEPGNLFVIESTSPVGTTEQMAQIIYAERPELQGKIGIAYCPERVLPGNVIHELVHNDRVIGGIDEQSTSMAADFYRQFVQGQLHRTNCRTAELCKLTENASRDVQIAFANELSLICDRAGIDVWELIALANKHPRVNILQPGCGVGGHCIAVDPYFITSAFTQEAHMIAQAREVNNGKALWCAEKVKNAILQYRLDHGTQPVVALMGLAFKPNIDDLRESPAVEIARQVMASNTGATILAVEPNIGSHPGFELVETGDAIARANIVVMLTAHNQFKDITAEALHGKQVLDFCGLLSRFKR